MKILGIETSCDETAASVVEDGVRILSNVVVSQIDIFAEYGGVIPEVAARSHLEAILPVVRKALANASCSWEDIDAIAVTHAPGLLGSLLIGTLTARTLAILYNKPLYAVHHLKSHVYSNWLLGAEGLAEPIFSNHGMHQKKQVSATPAPLFPLLALVVSGGHTQILYMRGHNQFEIVGTTIDDAVGECFDKVAKILGLPYPGGPSIAAVAEGDFSFTLGSKEKSLLVPDANKYKFPHPKVPKLDFSFSGLKTAVLREVQKAVGMPISYPSHKLKELLSEQQVCDFAASFQKTAVDILVEKMGLAVLKYPEARSIVVAGGVSANKVLRERVLSEFVFSDVGLEVSEMSYTGRPAEPPASQANLFAFGNSSRAASSGIYISENSNHFIHPKKTNSATRSRVFFPSPSLSGDNGAMVAAAAYYEILSGVEPTDPYSLNIYPRVSVEQ